MYTCVYTHVFRKVCLSVSTYVYILICAHTHTRICRVCGLSPGIGNRQTRPLTLEGSMVQYKEAWVKPKVETLK